MPTRKQRRRTQKERRHEYETVWVDSEGNELDEPPEDVVAVPEKRTNGAKPKAKVQAQSQRGSRSGRVPPAPSWRRSVKRSLIWIGVLGTLLILLQSRAAHPSYAPVIGMVAVYALIFPLFTYWLDRFMYRRYQAKMQASAARKR
jgi:hypothetical protein